MRTPIASVLAASALLSSPGLAQTAGSTLVGVSVTEVREIARGWSAKETILGRDVYNDLDEIVGQIDDIIIGPDKELAYAIVNAGGFLNVTRHDVAIPVTSINLVGEKLVIAGATRQALQDSPRFEYAN
jgi:sporulation protein YlmC with PRC-barrel domain